MNEIVISGHAQTSVINQIELLGFAGKVSELQVLEQLLGAITILPLTEEIVLRTINLRKQLRIKLPDAIIAATALVHKLVLVSRNRKDFIRIEGLEVVDPYSLTTE